MTLICNFSGNYRFLSNFYPHSVNHEGIDYPTNEALFQALKTDDPVDRQRIANAITPGEAKRLGRTVKLRPDWEQVKYGMMLYCLRLKFARDSVLATRLIDTYPNYLEERNNWKDRDWGVDKFGKNMLGILLMQVRAELMTAADIPSSL